MKKTSILSIILLMIIFGSCKRTEKENTFEVSTASVLDTISGSCPYLTKNEKGHLIISYIRQTQPEKYSFSFAVSENDGATFLPPIEIPGSGNIKPHGENIPKIICKPSGEIIALWGAANPNPKNAYSGLIYYTQSFDKGKTWGKVLPLTKDTGSYDQRYFDVALLPNGEAAAVWLDNRKKGKKEGSGLYFATTNGSNGFENEKLISEPCCPCCRTDLMVDSKNNINIVYRGILNDSIRDMVHIVSKDNGTSFSSPKKISSDNWVINGCPHTGPAITENNEGLHFAWFTAGGGSGIYYSTSKDGGSSFSTRQMISGKMAKHCQISSLPNGTLLTVWNESFSSGSAVSNRIGIEKRNADGNNAVKQFITAENSKATYPVIQPINNNAVLIAYTENETDKEQIVYKKVVYNN